MSTRTGRCLCGAVSYAVHNAPDSFGACHCTMCQRISGGVNMSFHATADQIEITGSEAVRSYRSSDDAERSFCSVCGSNLWYRGVEPSSGYSIAFGTLDDKSGMRLEKEICIETKPDAYGLAGDQPRMTSAEALS